MEKHGVRQNIQVLKRFGRKLFESLLKGSIPGMLSLEKAMEIMYIRLEFIENGTLSDMEEKPLGIRFVEFYGCPLGTGPLADCGTHWTRVSTNSTAYRHIGYCIHHLHCMHIISFLDMITI